MYLVIRSGLSRALLLILAAPSAAAQSLTGYWPGAMVREGARLPISLAFRRGTKGWSGTWSAPTMRAVGVPLSEVRLEGNQVWFALVGDQSSTRFEAGLHGDSLVGTFSGGEGEGTFSAARRPLPVVPYREEEVIYSNGDVRLAGSLLLPPGEGRHPAVVFMHGSGAEGRFGSRYLADYLARHGIAALISDKRGVGGSTGDWRYSTLEDLAQDALAGVRLLKGRREIDPTAIGTYGHSQGGLITPIVATRSADVAFVIAGASYGGVTYEQDLFRVAGELGRSQFTPGQRQEAMAYYRRFIEALRTGAGIDQLFRDLAMVDTLPWIKWLGIPPRENWLWKFYPPVGSFNPLPLWEKVRVPVLLLYGQNDQIVPVDTSIRRIGQALARGGNGSWGAVMLPRAEHAFTINPKPGEPFEWRVVAPGLAEVVTGWVLLQARRIHSHLSQPEE